jgi:hypothetical protein
MGRRIRSLWLFMALASASTEDFIPAINVPPDRGGNQVEVYPIALRYRTDLQTDLELTPAAVVHVPTLTLFLGANVQQAGLQETIPQVFSSADLCHTFMSMQW